MLSEKTCAWPAVSEEGTLHRAVPSLKYAAGGIALPDQLKLA
jgi:hypothetical protein